VYDKEGEEIICDLPKVFEPAQAKLNQHNAHLIAAAPELLAALKALVNNWKLEDNYTKVLANIENAKVAIAKAEAQR
jgi:hypothetical protein